MFGTDFSYEDFERLLGMAADASRTRLPDAELEGRPVYVLEGRPAPDSGSAYERVVTFVERERCVALRTESWERAGGLRKLLEADPQQITREGSDWIARSQKLSDLQCIESVLAGLVARCSAVRGRVNCPLIASLQEAA